MLSPGALALFAGGMLSALAAVAHLACILFGAPTYRFLGAGEHMVRAVKAGKLRPTLVTMAIASMLLVWAAYALSGAGVIAPLPATRVVLPAVCLVYLARAVGFPLLKPVFPENSNTFWWVSSGICLLLGMLHTFGIISQWSTL